ncbi:MAG: hypothetical protein ACREOD_05050 [Candidatus Dormibacteria bacterium]
MGRWWNTVCYRGLVGAVIALVVIVLAVLVLGRSAVRVVQQG